MLSGNLNTAHTILEKIVEYTYQVFFIYDPQETRFVHINNAFIQIWERDHKDFMNRDASVLADTIHPEDKNYVCEQYEHLMTEKLVKNVEFRILLPENTSKWVCLTAYVIQENGKELIAGMVEDISQMKEYNFNILKFNAKKNSVLEILSHDLSAPFATIQGMVSLLQKKTEHQADESIHQLLGIIEETCKRGRNLIRDFVDNEFLESSQIVLNKERVDIVQRVRHIVEEYKNLSLWSGKDFTFTVDAEPIYMEVDPMKFMQVINNLVSNALKFTEDDGRIAISISNKEDKVLFTVQDNGLGIPQEMHPYLFDKFTKARRPGIRGEQSTGLGMSIIKNIVELHEGKIWFESKEKQGSTFYIEMPRNDN